MTPDELGKKYAREIKEAFAECSQSGMASKIDVIKRVRSRTGLDLKSSKEAVEAYALANGIHFAEGSLAGCGSTAMLGIFLIFGLVWIVSMM